MRWDVSRERRPPRFACRLPEPMTAELQKLLTPFVAFLRDVTDGEFCFTLLLIADVILLCAILYLLDRAGVIRSCIIRTLRKASPAPSSRESEETPKKVEKVEDRVSVVSIDKQHSNDLLDGDWNAFVDAFHKRPAHVPFPSIELAPPVSPETVEALVADPGLGVAARLADCRDAMKRRELAREFLARFPKPESEWSGASVLLTAASDTTYWVVGDVHACVDAIAKVCAVVADRHRRGLTKDRNIIVLLGDYVDRGNEPLEALAFIESLKLRHLFAGLEVMTLAGNHDVGLLRDADGKYASMVSPSETATFLQTCVDAGKDVSVEAESAMRLAAASPRMCELTGIDPNDKNRTMLFVHAGVPHVDLQERLYAARRSMTPGVSFFQMLANESVADDLRRACAEDFTWVRFAKDLPVKRPNRGSHGCEIGTEDVAQYLYLHRALTSRDITFVFRGHDHERSGFACYSPHPALNPTTKKFVQRECNVLTLNTMEPDDSSGGMFRERDLAFAEWSLGEPVRLHRIVTRHLGTSATARTPQP